MWGANFLTNFYMDRKENILAGAISGAVAAAFVLAIFGNFGARDLNNEGQTDTNGILEEILSNDEFVSQEDLVVSAVKKSQPAVVSVIITKDVPVLEQYYEEYNSPFDDLFGGQGPFNFQIPKYREKGTEKKEVGGGSGFIVSKDGYIVTNKHVVNDEDAEYTVFLNDGSEHSAKVLASDPLNDIAILKIDAKDLPYLNFGDSDKLMPGQTAIAIGNPLLEFENSVSVGVVSGLGRSVVAGDRFGGFSEQLEGVIQTDAAINPGNSGGPLLNLNGEVIGVNVAVASAENIAFSIPANLVKQIFDSVKEHGKIVRAFLGIRYVQINEKMKEANNLSVDYGVLVSKGEKPEDLAVIPGSPADKAGLVENDIILEIDGKKLDGETSMARIISEKKVGDSIKLKMLSRGKEKTVTVRLEEMKNE